MTKEEDLRRQAVKLHEEGVKVAVIARLLGRSRQWVYKWIERHGAGTNDWSRSVSRAPHNPSNCVEASMEEAVIESRQKLMSSPYMESGAYAIWNDLRRSGMAPPSVATINRILKRNGLANTKPHYQKSGIDYPPEPKDMQMMDLIGPRYLHGGQRYYLLTIISNQTRYAGVYPILTKNAEDVTGSVVSFWKEYTLPSYLQLDNELSFKGSNRHPRGLGLLLRTALKFNVIPRFIPVKEPWRNGVVERFNQTVQNALLTQEHRDFDELRCHAADFVRIHNSAHHYSTLRNRTPAEMCAEQHVRLRPLDGSYAVGDRPALDKNNINEIDFIRLVRSDLIINVLNTNIKVDASMMHSYVEAKLMVNEHVLEICQDGIGKQHIEFVMPVI